jgi:hypothetical protein
MGNPFLFADRFSGAVVHLTTGNTNCLYYIALQMQNARDSKLRRHFFLNLIPQKLLAQAEFSDQVAVTGCVLGLQVGQQALTTIDHHDQTTAGVVI